MCTGQVCVPIVQQVDISFAQKLARSSNVCTSSGSFTCETLPFLLPSPGRLWWIEIIVIRIDCDIKVILIYVVKYLDDVSRDEGKGQGGDELSSRRQVSSSNLSRPEAG